MRIGFVGLGNIGGRCARHILEAGYDLVVADLDRDARQRLVEAGASGASDPAELAEAIVRWTTPSVYKRRTATQDTVLGGQAIRAGEKVVVWEMSANRDGAVFDSPFEFRINRSPNNHLGFGHGPHFCLGANLARLEIDVMLNTILDRWADVEIVGEATWTRTNRLSGLKTLPVEFNDRAYGHTTTG